MASGNNTAAADHNYHLYPYSPSHALAALFSVLIGVSLVIHIYQHFRYRFFGVSFWMLWGGSIYLAGWITRCISSYNVNNINVYITTTVFIYLGPPIYSAMAYNLVGRLMNYLPMFATLNPNRVVHLYVYAGIIVEAVTANGAAKTGTANGDISKYRSGGTLISIGLVLQAVVESSVMINVALIHYRCTRSHMLPRNVRTVCITLYGTSTFVLLRCIFRAVQSFGTNYSNNCLKPGQCSSALQQEWFLYALEAVPMVLFTYWINILHPGRYLPRQKKRYLDFDGRTERNGPGWKDRRSKWKSYTDPFDMVGLITGNRAHDQFWLRPDSWPECEGIFAIGTGSNVKKGRKMWTLLR